MTRHIGFLIPSSNIVVEAEFGRLPPPEVQAHFARLQVTSVDEAGFRTQDADIDYQSRLLGTAKVELVALIQTSASFFEEGWDEAVTRRMAAEAGVPALTAAQAVGRAARALGARRIAQVSPYSPSLSAGAQRYFETQYGLEMAAVEGFGMTDANAIAHMGAEIARAAFARVNRPDVEALVLPGGNFASMPHIANWEAEFGKPVITSNQACLWASYRDLGITTPLPGYGRLLAELPSG